VITRLDQQLTMPIDYAADLLDTLDLLSEVLRYASDELRHEIIDHYPPSTNEYLIETVDHHAGLFRRATSPAPSPEATR
jgi:hypothetical protein